jgi:hypothetical protein
LARPGAAHVEIRQYQQKTGYIPWSPTLTLAQAIEIAGGFVGRNNCVSIEHFVHGPTQREDLTKAAFLRDPKKQKQLLQAGDRLTLDHLIAPW